MVVGLTLKCLDFVSRLSQFVLTHTLTCGQTMNATLSGHFFKYLLFF